MMCRLMIPCIAAALLTVSLPLSAYEGQLDANARLVLTSHRPDALLVMDREGVTQWRSDLILKHPQQVSALPDGRVICATIDGAAMLNSDGSEQWRYQVPEGAENAVALHLAKGRILVAHEGRGELVELNDAGELRGVTEVEPVVQKTHGQFRYVGYGDGNYLVPMLNTSMFREIKPGTGEVLWEIPDLKTVTFALRRPDGGTYIGYRDTIASYNAEREQEWLVRLTADLGIAKAVPPTGSILLPDGNLIVALWHRHQNVPDLIEFNPVTKKIVHQWDVASVCQIGSVDRLPVGHLFVNEN